MKLSIALIGIIIVGGLLTVNILLINKADEAKKSEEFYKMKFETQKGDIDLLTYDLITSRDSVRILNKELENCRQQTLTSEE